VLDGSPHVFNFGFDDGPFSSAVGLLKLRIESDKPTSQVIQSLLQGRVHFRLDNHALV
jgi:hypothetical protein